MIVKMRYSFFRECKKMRLIIIRLASFFIFLIQRALLMTKAPSLEAYANLLAVH